MSNADRPLYVVLHGEELVTDTACPLRSVPLFGTAEDAAGFARGVAGEKGESLSAFRVAEFRFTGNVAEVRP